jgi:hypothetical protein
VELPNPNEVTPMSTGGTRRGPHVNAPDATEYSFEVPFVPVDANAPFEVALGSRTTTTEDPDGTTGSGDEYDKHLFTEADRLPTMTVEHAQSDMEFTEWFVGSKAGLQLEASQGESLSATMSVTAATQEYDDAVSSTTDISVPSSKTPYRFWMAGDVTLSDPADGSAVETLATVKGMDLSWDNGLEAQHHGRGREAHAVAETTAAEKYDMSLTVDVTDTGLYKRAADGDAPVDVEIPFYREGNGPDARDALFVRLQEATITSAPIPNPSEGVVEAEIGLAPRATEIEIREPAGGN